MRYVKTITTKRSGYESGMTFEYDKDMRISKIKINCVENYDITNVKSRVEYDKEYPIIPSNRPREFIVSCFNGDLSKVDVKIVDSSEKLYDVLSYLNLENKLTNLNLASLFPTGE